MSKSNIDLPFQQYIFFQILINQPESKLVFRFLDIKILKKEINQKPSDFLPIFCRHCHRPSENMVKKRFAKIKTTKSFANLYKICIRADSNIYTCNFMIKYMRENVRKMIKWRWEYNTVEREENFRLVLATALRHRRATASVPYAPTNEAGVAGADGRTRARRRRPAPPAQTHATTKAHIVTSVHATPPAGQQSAITAAGGALLPWWSVSSSL